MNTENAHHEHAEDHDAHHWCPKLDRRTAMRLLGMTTVATATGCGAGGTLSAITQTTGTIATTTTLTASATAVEQNTNVTLSSMVAPTVATGSVTFYSGSASLGTVTLNAGSATLTATFKTVGTQVLTAVYSGSSTYAASTSTSLSIIVSASATSCAAATLEGEEGPYFVDDSASGYLRSNILSNLDGSGTQTGIPLYLTIYVFDTKKSCAAMQGVQVDIWHCNAQGVYSAEAVESTTSQSWLRGYQISDSNGKVEFQTIVPGWYQGRTTHIHLRFRSTYDSTSNSGSNTMQVFFNQTLVDTIDTSVAPYSSEGKNNTTNASDHVYTTEEQGTTLLTLTGSNSAGYTATFNAYMTIS
jgi:hypothetical protein